MKLGVADEVVPEPPGGAHTDAEQTAQALKDALLRNLDELSGLSDRELVDRRYERLQSYGRFTDTKAEAR